MEYSRIFGSNFPRSLIEVGMKQDVDDTVIDLVNQYYTYMNESNVKAANALYQANVEKLEPYSIKAKDFNLLLEETYNIGLHVLQQTKSIISETEPTTMAENGVWYELLEVVE